jgi:hypothetical protein
MLTKRQDFALSSSWGRGNRVVRIVLAVSLVLVLCVGAFADDQIFVWTDDNGATHTSTMRPQNWKEDQYDAVGTTGDYNQQSSQPGTANDTVGKRARTFGGGRELSNCDSGHWVDSVSSDGQIVKLEDGSLWEVNPVDAIDSMLWLPTTDIIVCVDRLINTDDNETVFAQRIR